MTHGDVKTASRGVRGSVAKCFRFLSAGALSFSLLLVLGLLLLLVAKGMGHFWQAPLVQYELENGKLVLGERVGEDKDPKTGEARYNLKIGNRDFEDLDFTWVHSKEIQKTSYPKDVALFERMEWGNFYGRFVRITSGGKTVAEGHKACLEVWGRGERFGHDDSITITSVSGQAKSIPGDMLISVVEPNRLGFSDKLGLYLSRLWGFVWDNPRETNTEGGVFPAIFGTVLMVFLMTLCVTPVGVLAALFLHEYAKQGLLVRIVRISVNNLAGVPSIVFGLFGLGFFVYGIGGGIDQLFFSDTLPTPTFGTGGILWASLTLALLTMPVVIVATEEGLSAVPRGLREASYGLGATKWETMRRVVVPAAMPGILTGVILAIARAAGEVAPLMIVGMVKLADLPLDSEFPYLHLDGKFMHLGFHIYDLGFQSPNIEATKPLVYTTALLLIVLVAVMNLLAIWLRNHLKAKYAGSAV